MQPEKLAETRAWFRRMEDDLRAADVDLGADPPLIADALFHCQQAVEKALKGFLTWHDRPFRKVHDLRELGAEAIAMDGSLELWIRRSIPLSPFATVFRYPYTLAEPSEEETRESVSLTREVCHAILARLPEGLRPATPTDDKGL